MNLPGLASAPTPSFRYPLTPVLVLVAAAPALGGAEAAVNLFREHMRERLIQLNAKQRSQPLKSD